MQLQTVVVLAGSITTGFSLSDTNQHQLNKLVIDLIGEMRPLKQISKVTNKMKLFQLYQHKVCGRV